MPAVTDDSRVMESIELEAKIVICDSQVHAPPVPPEESPVGGLSRDELLAQMSQVGVDRVVLVPLIPHTEECFEFVEENPDRFSIMGVFPLTEGPEGYAKFREWKAQGKVRGLRVSFVAAEPREMLEAGEIEWLWEAADQDALSVMVNIPDNVWRLEDVSARYPNIRFLIDHMGLSPRRKYSDFNEVLAPVLALAGRPNVAVKASCLPSSVEDGYPFKTIHEPLHQVIDAFGPGRVFWGSDLTRLPCTYSECLRLFTDELPFLSERDRTLILGEAVCAWLGWD